MATTISQFQTPCIRAMITNDGDGALFDYENDLATAEELAAETPAIDAPPASYTIYKARNTYGATAFDTANADEVEGFIDVELDPEECFLSAAAVEANELTYNFHFVPKSRATFPFAETGYYFIDVKIYPKTGAALVFRASVEVV